MTYSGATPAEWNVVGSALERTFQLKSFPAALAFSVEVGKLAEAADHHPDIEIKYRKVRLTLSTHDAGSVVTEKDVKLAEQINALSDETISTAIGRLF